MNKVVRIGSEPRRLLIGLRRACEEFRKLDPEIPVSYVVLLMEVAAAPEGMGLKDLGDRLGYSQSTTSRIVQHLGAWKKPGIKGHGLVMAYEDPLERRRKIVRLTPKGKAFVDELVRYLAA